MPRTYRVRDLHGTRMLLTGATERLELALLERLSTAHPGCHVSVTGSGSTPAGPLDVVVHCAPAHGPAPCLVTAFDTHVLPLADLCRRLPPEPDPPHLLYVSLLAYGGTEHGTVPESQWEHDADWRTELALARAAAEEAERLSHQPEPTQKRLRAARRVHGTAGLRIVAREAERLRRAWVGRRMREQGESRARALGLPDTTALVAALAERAAEELWGERRLTILRPSLIGHALRRPHPGWAEGQAMTYPLEVARASAAGAVMDIVPADLVADAVLAAAATAPSPGSPHYFHLGTGTANPLRLGQQRDHHLRGARPRGIYVPSQVTYDDREMSALRDAASSSGRYDFDVRSIDWRTYVDAAEKARAARRLEEPVAQRAPLSVRPGPLKREEAGVIAVFDLDGTVLASDLVESYVWTRLALLPRRTWPTELMSLARGTTGYLMAERRGRSDFVHAFLRRYAGTEEAILREMVGGSVGDALLHRVRPGAVRRIREHRAAGHRTILVTGTPEPLIAPLRPLFDHVAASRLHTQGGVMTGSLLDPPPVGEARARWLNRYAAEHGLDLSLSYGYADSYSDRAFLEAVGRPCAVDPDARLLRHALRHRWPVARWGAHTASRWSALAAAVPLTDARSHRPAERPSHLIPKESK
ncbi:haloacid dehalogenase-like hydrolase [Streptomyces sp. AK010]|uniref:haloacid dehalogenase-like hydrolase n=1 Tax=Streptomyces sp. AK010 TaxID=2723074 RepID=UPI001622E168|nr:haloacid dehalogenase-like hydrolase [Streptomyces sp. AK010]MBB6421505.1 HAD superfamily hydrolase (TIGR01490 family) [Streptomyces sp. AK010]